MTMTLPEPDHVRPRSPSPRRWLRRLGIGATGLLTAVVILVGLLQLPPVATAVVRKLLTLAPLNPGNRLEVGRVSGNFFGELTLENVRLRQADRELAAIQRLRVAYRLPRLRPPMSRIDELEVNGARLAPRRRDGRWDLAEVLRKSSDTTGGGGFTVGRLRVKDAAVAAELSPDSVVGLRVMDLAAHDLVIGKVATVAIDGLDLALRPPASARWFTLETRGGVTADEIRLDPLRVHTESSELTGMAVVPRRLDDARLVDRLDVRLTARPLDLADLAEVVPSVPRSGKLRFDARAAADGELVTAHLAASLDRARLTLDGGTRLHGGKPTSYRVHGAVSALDPSRLNVSAPTGTLNGRLDADVTGPLRQADGRARLLLAGSRLGTTVVREIELGAVLTRGSADLTLRGALDTGLVRVTGRARPFDSIPTYRLAGSARRMPGTAAVARTLAGADGDPTLVIGFRLSGTGRSPDSARVRGRVELTAVRDTGASVPVGHADLRLAEGTLDLRPVLLAAGGRITALGRVGLRDTMTYELRQGRIEGVDLRGLSGDTTSVPLTGRFSLAGRGTAPAVARATARLHLDELRAGGRRIGQVDAVVRLEHGRLQVDGGGALQGGRLELEAVGRPFDSTATYVLRHAALERVDLGSLVGRPNLAGPVTLRLAGEARSRGTARTLRARLTVEPSRLGRVEVSDGEATVQLAGGRLAYEASLRGPGGALSLAGSGTPSAAAPVYEIRDGRIASVDLGRLLGRPDLRTDLNLTFTADVTKASPDSVGAGLDVVLLPSRVNQAQLSGGSLAARLRGGELDAKLRADGPDAAMAADITRRAAEGVSALTARGNLRLEHLAHWTGRREADGRLESRFALESRSDSGGFRTLAGTIDALGGIGGVRLQTLHVALSAAEGQLRVDTLQVRSNVAAIDGGGRLALRTAAAPGRLALRATLGDLAPVAALAGADTVAFDSARVHLVATGPARQWRLDGGADAYGLALGGNLANRITLAGGATLDSSRVRAMNGELRVTDAAYGKLTVRELTAAGRYDSTLALDLNVNVGDSVRIGTRMRGAVSTARDTLRAEVDRLTLDEGGRAWTLDRPVGFVLGRRVEVHDLALRAGPRSITLNGVIDRRDSSDMTLGITGLELETLRATGLVPIGGRLDGSLHLSGRATSPRLQGRLGLAILSRHQRQIGSLVSTLDWTRAGLRIAAAATPQRGGALTINGMLPYRLTLAPRDTSAAAEIERTEADTVSLAVRADSFSLALFQPLLPPDAARRLRGRLQADTRIGGSIRKPQATGSISLTRAALELPAIKVAYDAGELVGRLEGQTLRIERLGLRTGKHQTLTATGTILLQPLSEPGLDLVATLDHFRLVNSNQLQTAASGRIQLSGTLLKPALSGSLRLDRTNFFVGAAAAQAKVEQVDLTPEDMRRLARDFGPAVLAHARETPGLMDRVKLGLDIQMPNQVWIRRVSTPKTNIELSGRLKLTQEPGQDMHFLGHVEPVPDRGTIELNGRQFRLTDGDINLVGPVDSTRLDVNASYQVPTQGGGDDEGVLISVHATGRLDSLGLDFTSDPSMSQDDILSYIVTGRPASDNPLFEGEGGGGGAGQVALGTLTSAISNAAGQGLGFDVFQIRQEPTRGLTLTAGRYLGSRLFLDMQLPLQLSAQNRQAGANLGPGFELEYTLQRWLRANLRGGSLSPGLLFRTRRAY
jgi:translocation and assembly module TamB